MKLLTQEENQKVVEARKIVERAMFELYEQAKGLGFVDNNPSEEATSLYEEVFGEGTYTYRYSRKSAFRYCVEVCKVDKSRKILEPVDIVFLTYRFSKIIKMLKDNKEITSFAEAQKFIKRLCDMDCDYSAIYAIAYYTAPGGYFFKGTFNPAQHIEILDNLFRAEQIYFKNCKDLPVVREVGETGYKIYRFDPFKDIEEIKSEDFYLQCIPKQVNRYWVWKNFKEQYPEFGDVDTTDENVDFGKFIPAERTFDGKKVLFLSDNMKKRLHYYVDKKSLYSLFVFKNGVWTKELVEHS